MKAQSPGGNWPAATRNCSLFCNSPAFPPARLNVLSSALESVDGWRRYVLARQFDDREGWELQNLLTLARVMIQAALAREESRGVHLRTDFPQMDDAQWNKHLWFVRGDEAELSGAA